MNDNTSIPDNLIDRAYDIMSTELSHWQIVGPQHDPSGPFWTAARAPEQMNQTPAILTADGKPMASPIQESDRSIPALQRSTLCHSLCAMERAQGCAERRRDTARHDEIG
jgi:hypothetical protein